MSGRTKAFISAIILIMTSCARRPDTNLVGVRVTLNTDLVDAHVPGEKITTAPGAFGVAVFPEDRMLTLSNAPDRRFTESPYRNLKKVRLPSREIIGYWVRWVPQKAVDLSADLLNQVKAENFFQLCVDLKQLNNPPFDGKLIYSARGGGCASIDPRLIEKIEPTHGAMEGWHTILFLKVGQDLERHSESGAPISYCNNEGRMWISYNPAIGQKEIQSACDSGVSSEAEGAGLIKNPDVYFIDTGVRTGN